MSHRLGAVSSDYCSVCQNGPLPSAAAAASNPLWPLAAPFLMTNCQPAPTKARLKCQHRMTKGPRGSSETNCVQCELILYSRAGPAGCWLLAGLALGARGGRPALCLLRPQGGPASVRGGHRGPGSGIQGPPWSLDPGRGVATEGGTNPRCGMQITVPAMPRMPRVFSRCPRQALGTARAAVEVPRPQKVAPHKQMVIQSSYCFVPCAEPEPLHTRWGHGQGAF